MAKQKNKSNIISRRALISISITFLFILNMIVGQILLIQMLVTIGVLNTVYKIEPSICWKIFIAYMTIKIILGIAFIFKMKK